jgi:hypothetical protein
MRAAPSRHRGRSERPGPEFSGELAWRTHLSHAAHGFEIDPSSWLILAGRQRLVRTREFLLTLLAGRQSTSIEIRPAD